MCNSKTANRLVRLFAYLILLEFDFSPGLKALHAQEFGINQAAFEPPNRLIISYAAEASVPYVLLQGDSVTNIVNPVLTNSGPAGLAQFVQTIAPLMRERYFRIRRNAPFTPVLLDPVSNASDVGVTVRPKATFPKPIVTGGLNAGNFFASFAGHKLPATIVPANDGTFAWLFFDPPMPSASQISVTVDGSSIRAQDGTFLDADADGTPGGAFTSTFSTVSVAPLSGTALAGRVVDPGPDLAPRTFDDVASRGGSITFLLPIAGVKVYLLGLEDHFVFTDAKGWFQLDSVPAGDVKVVLDGRTATTGHAGFYWPEMVMDTHNEPGITNYITMIGRATNALTEFLQTMYLPRVASNVLQTITASVTNTIRLQSKEAAYDLPPAQVPYLTVELAPNSLIGMNGQPMASGQVGISVVPPELVADMLPPGLLQHTFDITVQAPGIATFATPAPMTFPNVFGAPPGTKLNFLSFDHTTGRLVIEGTASVSADGLSVHTDPGTGVTHPGWHGLTPPGANGGGGGGGGPNPCPDCSKPKNCDNERNSAISSVAQCAVGVAAAIPKSVPVIGCAIGFGLGAIGAAVDCNLDFSGCEKSIGLNTVGTLVGCIPVIGGSLGAAWGCGLQAGTALIDYNGCLNVVGKVRERSAAPQIPQNIFLEQQALWAAAAEVYAIVLGNPKWIVIDPQDLLKAQAIFQALQASIDSSGPGGERIIPSERDAILQLPLPVNISAADAGALLGRFDQLMSGQAPTGGLDLTALSSAASNLVQVATILEARGWQTTFDAYLRGIPDLAAEQDQALKDESAGGTVSLVPTAFYKLTSLSDGFVQRGRMPNTGGFDQLFLAADSFFTLEYVDPATGKVALTAFRSGVSGSSFAIPRAIFVDSSSPDTDGDGLSDEAEEIIGTDSLKFSTCGDGISDFAKVQQGLDLANCLPPPTGIIASLPVPGEAKEVVLEGSTTDARQQTAYLACGSRGLSIVNVTKVQMPILLGQLDLAGDSTDVSVDSKLKIAAVAANAGGLHLVDVSDPMRPKLLQTIADNANQVEVWDGIVYAGVGSALNSYDLLTGERLQTLHFGAGLSFTGLAREGPFLYTMDGGPNLRVVDISGPVMIARGSLTMSNGGGKLFVGNGIAYVPAGDGNLGGGFSTVNVSNSDAITLLSGVDNNGVGGTMVAANGSGLAIAVGFSDFVVGRYRALDVLDVSDPTNTGDFIGRFNLAVEPKSVAIGAGIAFVADGANGLQIVNYLPFDNHGVAPIVSIETLSTNVIEGSLLPIHLQVSDDVQVRNVELLVNGTVVQNAVSFPFDLVAAVPLLAAGSSNVLIQVRATDTGGNIGLSDPITIQLVPDNVPPTIVRIDPANNASRSSGLRAVTIDFSEPLDEKTGTAQAMQLIGPAGVVPPQNIQFRVNGAEVQLTYAGLDGGEYQIIIDGSAVKDRAGNALGSSNIVSHFTIGAAGTLRWINPGGGVWDEPSNWSGGTLPGPADNVVIDLGGNATVTFRQGTSTIHSLVSSNAFRMTGGSLTIGTTFRMENVLALSGGTIIGATISAGTSSQIVVTNVPGVGKMVLDGVTLASDLKLGDPTFTTSLTITNGLTLNGAKLILQTLQYANSEIIFTGTQTLGGSGEVVFAGKGGSFRTYGNTTPDGANVLTIASGVTLHGIRTGATSDDSSTLSGRNFDMIVNEGTIIADVTNQTINIFWDGPEGKFINRGTIRANTQGLLAVRGMLNQGTVSASAGGQLSLQGSQGTLGSWTNMATIAVTNSTLTMSGNWSNSGTISAVNSTVNIGGAFTTAGLGIFNRTGGLVNFYGVMDNTGATFAVDAAWNFQGGTIKGGAITSADGGTFVVNNRSSGTLDGVNLQMPLKVAGSLTIKNGLTLNGLPLTLEAGAYVIFIGTQTLDGIGEVVFGPDPNGFYTTSFLSTADEGLAGPATLTIGPNITVHGQGSGGFTPYRYDTIINQGIISADSTNETITLGQTSDCCTLVINQGTVQGLNGGKLAMTNTNINSGQLTPGNPPQVLDVKGTFIQQAAGILNIHIKGTTPGTDFSQVNTTGAVTLDGTLNLTRINGYEPNLGDTFVIMTYPSASGQFTDVKGLEIGNGKRFDLNYGLTGLTLTVVSSP